MAQLLSPSAPVPGRISQILPTVKCSSCNQPVRISELGDHVCATPPAMPPVKPPMSPRSNPATLLSQKYQNITRSQTPPAQQKPTSPSTPTSTRQASPLSPLRTNSAVPAPTQPLRIRSTSTVSPANVPAPPVRPDRGSSLASPPNAPDSPKVAFPTRPGPSGPPRTPSPLSSRPPVTQPLRVKSPLSNRTSSEPPNSVSPLSIRGRPESNASRTPSQSFPTSPPSTGPASRSRAPSNASSRPGPSSIRQPTQSSPAPYVPPPNSAAPASNGVLSPPDSRPRAATNASGPPSSNDGDVIYSTGNRPGLPSSYGQRTRAPSNASLSPHAQLSPSMSPRMSSIQRYPSPQPQPEPDTKIGGEAGMAGVGRRGFAAAARAAMFAGNLGGVGMQQGREERRNGPWVNMDAVQGMDGRRANAPRFLDITSARNYASASTPPLSPNSGSSHSPHSPISASLPSPNKDGRESTTPTRPAIVSRTPSPSGPGRPFFHGEARVVPPQAEPPKSALPPTPTTPSSIRLPFFEKFKNTHPSIDVKIPAPDKEDEPSPLSPGSESDYGGLAYADSTDDEDDVPISASIKPTPSLPSIAGTLAQADAASSPVSPVKPPDKVKNRVRFPSMSSKTQSIHKSESNYSSSSPSSTTSPIHTNSPRLPTRSLSASTATSSYSIRSAAKSTGALDRAMETLFEEDATSSTVTSTSSPAMFPSPLAAANGDAQRDSISKPVKLPTRSHTSPILGAGRPDSRHGAGGKRRAGSSKVKVCVKCEKTIDDGRWIQMDGGSVLCDRCWKNMYLPKCRRCNKTIEKQAVSSSDGQLKGKYHRECFSCHTCQKPFPDKSFYVFDGKPFCAYHYHEANDSLCAAATCGQPIEGPCAVSHAGDKYHPEHLLCEYSRCVERLVEYWEVDGRMLCERHANLVMRGDELEDDDEEREREQRVTKRVTRFIDLAALNAGGGSAGGGGESELR